MRIFLKNEKFYATKWESYLSEIRCMLNESDEQ